MTSIYDRLSRQPREGFISYQGGRRLSRARLPFSRSPTWILEQKREIALSPVTTVSKLHGTIDDYIIMNNIFRSVCIKNNDLFLRTSALSPVLLSLSN